MESVNIPAISCNVPFNFLSPVGCVGLRESIKATRMPVPKTSIYEDNRFVAGKHHIGLTGQVLAVQAISEAFTVQSLSNQEFWPSVLAPDSRHHIAAFLRADAISQSKPPIRNTEVIRRALDRNSTLDQL